MLPIAEIREAEKIVVTTADGLLATSNDQKGSTGSDLRRACGDLKAFAEQYISTGAIASKLASAFVLARTTGATVSEFNRLRETILALTAVSLTAVTIKNVCVWFSLQQMSLGIVDETFTSREDVDKIRDAVNIAFNQAEESAADEMALVPYKTLIALHAAVVFHLYETARPLPQMLSYKFFSGMPTLLISQRLYDTGARADELREENKIIHPAFAAREGKALSF
jgi:prophage DNA circulation protein